MKGQIRKHDDQTARWPKYVDIVDDADGPEQPHYRIATLDGGLVARSLSLARIENIWPFIVARTS